MMKNAFGIKKRDIKNGVQLLFTVLCFINVVPGYSEECVRRQYQFDSIVCVCNSTYCDTIQKIRPPLEGNYIIYTSSKDGSRFQRTVGSFKDNVRVVGFRYQVNNRVKLQKFFGFGGAFTDATGINTLSLSEKTQENLLKSYYSSEGIEYSMGRVPIGGTDFSTRGYSYDDNGNKTDPNLTAFSLQDEDYKYKINLIKKAQSYANDSLKLVASCWSPPAWMKTNQHLTGFGSLKEEFYSPYANYHVKFLKEYEKKDISFWCVTTGNEPSNGISPINKLNSLGWTPATQTKWIGSYFGPAIRDAYPEMCILGIDDQRFVYPWWITWIMGDKSASKYITGAAVHWYWDFLIPAAVLRKTHERFPELFLLNTESSYGDKPWESPKVALGSWQRAEAYAYDMIVSFNNWVTGWIDWNLALNEEGGPNWVDNFVDAAIIVNATGDEFYKQPIFYALGHFSKFITPGSHRISESASAPNFLNTLAVVRPDNSTAIIVLNRKPHEIKFTLKTPSGSAVITVPRHSINSIVYR